MGNSFVGRADAVQRLRNALKGEASEKAEGPLSVLSIEGPGGIGKTYLFEHVLKTTNLNSRDYLTLRIDGPAARQHDRFHSAIRSLLHSAKPHSADGPAAQIAFPRTERILAVMDAIGMEAAAEFQKHNTEGDAALKRFSQRLDGMFRAGKFINLLLPVKWKFDCDHLRTALDTSIDKVKPKLKSLGEEMPRLVHRLGVGANRRHLRNAVRRNALAQLSDAFLADLTAMVRQNRRRPQAEGGKNGVRRLLLVLDDYESLQEPLGDFFVSYLLPKLARAPCETTAIILGRGHLDTTHVDWHGSVNLRNSLLPRVVVDRLEREEMDRLVEGYGLTSAEDKERAWRDTEGFPYYVELWKEDGGRAEIPAVLLKSFHDRTTRWFRPHEKEWLQFTLLLDRVDVETLKNVLEGDAAAVEVFRWFESEESIRDTEATVFRVREYLRSRLAKYLQITDPALYRRLEEKAKALAAFPG